MLIESSPTSLDPRIGTDAQSERIYSLLFDPLVARNNRFGLDPALALSWQVPDPQTYIFHLRSGVHFQDGRPLTARDAKWTIDSILNGTVITVKSGSYRTIQSVDTPDPLTLVIHLKKPDPALLWNLCDGAFGVVPYGSGSDFWRHPVGSGPFRFVSQTIDKDVNIERSPNYWSTPAQLARVRFAVVPDATTRALELEKGSADVEVNALTPDMIETLRKQPSLTVEDGPGTTLAYTVFNMHDPLLKDARIRRAIALGINRPLIIQSLLCGEARVADSVLPPEQPLYWSAHGTPDEVSYNPARANALLDAAGYRRGPDGIRFHLGMKTSTDETTRLLAVILQQQLSQIGIALDLRSFEFATFYADLVKGAFQLAPSRWIGGNEQPDIFHYAYSATSFPPHGGNRGYYASPQLDALLDDAAATTSDSQRSDDYRKIQQVLAHDLPSLNLWYLDTVIVHSRRLTHVTTAPSGNFEFLKTATLSH
ncbi:ABC transporter substrate-binding protein [Silvibacterium dinghuense]|uniref:ABC transporter substrate-binding protein n=2 Tax=Silvibacterium dinghuense TaxID=1560006 RepID=A0A4V1NVH1_9BACT|nr:ABC transporter substrate-binding protein [Silvibacterium dinghuense]